MCEVKLLQFVPNPPIIEEIRYPKNAIKRIIFPNGLPNIFRTNIPKKHLAYLIDWGNTLLNIRWRWILSTVCLVNFLGYYLFGLFWMWLAFLSGDFDETKSGIDKCVMNTNTLTGYFLLSVETIATIGYGTRYPTENCYHGWIMVVLQSLFSLAMQGMLVGLVYVKMVKPVTKSYRLFTKTAIICLRDSKLCFIIRIFDSSGKVSVGTKITMYFVDKEANSTIYIKQMMVQPYGLLLFPMEIVHVIDANSPLWKLTPIELANKNVEIIVVVEGSSTVTGQLSQHRTSYTAKNILWGHRFQECCNFDDHQQKYVVKWKKIEKTIQFDTALCSAQHLEFIRKQENIIEF